MEVSVDTNEPFSWAGENKVCLVVASHADDETLGVGGTMMKLKAHGWQVHVLVLTMGGINRRGAVTDQIDFGNGVRNALRVDSWDYGGFRDLTLEKEGVASVADVVRSAVRKWQPSLVFCNHVGDLHTDHRVAAEATHVACRLGWWMTEEDSVKMLLGYEITGNSNVAPQVPFLPNVFVDIDGYLEGKLAAMDVYGTEMNPWPHARSPEAVDALAKMRGASIGSAAAEAFVLVRMNM